MARPAADRKLLNTLEAIIRREIAAHGAIPFARFMDLALYHPEHGYYERTGRRIGRRGDYFTSVSVGGLFGELLAFQFARWLEEEFKVQSPEFNVGGAARTFQIVEAGAHDGRLAADVLDWLRRHRPGLFARLEYWIVEPSPRRREWQTETLAGFSGKVRWRDELPAPAGTAPAEPERCSRNWGAHAPSRVATGAPPVATGAGLRHSTVTRSGAPVGSARAPTPAREGACAPHLNGIVPTESISGILFANELLDALPVHRLGWDAPARRWCEWGVGIQQDRLVWQQLATVSGAVQREPLVGLPGCDRLEDLPPELLAVLPDGFTVEVCPRAADWWRTAASALARGWLVTFDYGLTAEELFRPERTGGTARAYRQHQSNADLLERPGEQDLTAHVHFAALQAAGEAAGLKTEGLFAQGQFLAHAVRQAAESGPAFSAWTSERTRQLRTLLHPDHLGRAFRVLVQTRHVSG